MTQIEFIRELTEALSGQVPQSVIMENVRYYENYIEEGKAAGKTEEEIIQELGSPRLIARTIIDTSENTSSDIYEEPQDGDEQESCWQDDSYEASMRKMKAGCVTAVLIAIIVMVAVFHIISFHRGFLGLLADPIILWSLK